MTSFQNKIKMRIIAYPIHFCRSQIRQSYITKTQLVTRSFSTNPKHVLTEEASSYDPDEEAKVELYFKTFLNRIIPESSSSPYDKAIGYLNAAAPTCNFQTVMTKTKTDTSNLVQLPSENFTPGIVYDLVAELPGIDTKVTQSLLDFIESHMNSDGRFNFFVKKRFNDDVDDTSVCLWALLNSKRLDSTSKLARSVANVVSMNTTPDTIFQERGKLRQVIQTYFPPHKYSNTGETISQMDPVVMSNGLRLLYFLQMADLATNTQDFIHDWLLDDRKFYSGSWYYESPDSLLYFLSNSVLISEQAHSKFHHILTTRLLERLGNKDCVSAMDQAKRILTAFNLGLIDPTPSPFNSEIRTPNKVKELGEEREKLVQSQTRDGSWPLEPFYRMSYIRFYNRTALTAFAAKALHVSRSLVS